MLYDEQKHNYYLMQKINFLLFFLLSSFFLQNIHASTIDSLKNKLPYADTDKRIDLYIEISGLYEKTEPDSAIKYLTLADNLCRINDIKNEDLLTLFADIYIEKQQFETAISYLQDILQISIVANDSLNIIKLKNRIGSLYLSLEKNDMALSKHMDALKMSKEINNKRTGADALTYIGNVFYRLGNYEEALLYYKKALAGLKELNDSIGESYIYNNLGEVYKNMGKFELALSFCSKSLEIKKRHSYFNGIAISYNTMGEVYEKQYEFEKAIGYYKKSLALWEHENSSSGIIETNVMLARVYRKISKLNMSKALLNRSLILANSKTPYRVLIMINKELSYTYEAAGDYDAALKFYKKFSALKDSIKLERNSTELHKMRINLDNQNKEEKIQKLEEEKRVEQKAFAKQKNMTLYLLAAFVVVLLSGLLLLRQYKLRLKANRKLKDQNKSLEEAEKLLILQKEQAERADMSKSVFLANMSHDIRSPMNAIIGFSDIVAQSLQSDNKAIEYLNYVKQSGNSLLRLIDDIIDIAKIEAGQLKLRKQAFGLNVLMNELFVSFQTIINQKPNNKVLIKLNIPSNCDNIGINSDEMRLKQVLTNFLSNAVKFTDEGIIELGYRFLPEDNMIFYVKDSGVGISKDQQELIFQRFGQVEESYTRNYTGTGLGLAISQNIIDMLGGDIWVESEPGIGANFFFKIPVEIIETQAGQDINKNRQFKHYNWQAKQILLVEDDETSLKLLKSLLQNTLIKIVTANDGQGAIKLIKEHKIDLVLMDIQLPELNGFEATKQIKKLDKDIPVIAVSAYAMQSELEMAKDIGFDRFVTKPFNINDLLSNIDGYLTKS